jgi:hypothetical protein
MQGKILATVLTIPASRLRSTDNALIAFDEKPAGSPHPMKAWFYPGCLGGEEFLRPNRRNRRSPSERLVKGADRNGPSD